MPKSSWTRKTDRSECWSRGTSYCKLRGVEEMFRVPKVLLDDKNREDSAMIGYVPVHPYIYIYIFIYLFIYMF